MIEENIQFLLIYLIPALCVAIFSWGIFEYFRKYMKGFLRLALPPALAIVLLLVIPLIDMLFLPGEIRSMVSQFVFFFIAAMALLVMMMYLGDRNIFRTFPLFTVFIMFFFTIVLTIAHLLLGNPEIASFFRLFLSTESTVLSILMGIFSNMIMFLIFLICAALIVFPLVYLEKIIREMREPQ